MNTNTTKCPCTSHKFASGLMKSNGRTKKFRVKKVRVWAKKVRDSAPATARALILGVRRSVFSIA